MIGGSYAGKLSVTCATSSGWIIFGIASGSYGSGLCSRSDCKENERIIGCFSIPVLRYLCWFYNIICGPVRLQSRQLDRNRSANCNTNIWKPFSNTELQTQLQALLQNQLRIQQLDRLQKYYESNNSADWKTRCSSQHLPSTKPIRTGKPTAMPTLDTSHPISAHYITLARMIARSFNDDSFNILDLDIYDADGIFISEKVHPL